MVHVFRAANWLTDSGEKAAMGAVDARMGTERNPGQRKTTEPKMDYEPSDDKDFEATVSVLKEKYPDAPKMIIAQVLNKTRRDSKRRNDDFSDHDHLNAAYDEAYAQLDQLGYDSR
jgi:hypothetical protein